jgi:hypothetical protein
MESTAGGEALQPHDIPNRWPRNMCRGTTRENISLSHFNELLRVSMLCVHVRFNVRFILAV